MIITLQKVQGVIQVASGDASGVIDNSITAAPLAKLT